MNWRERIKKKSEDGRKIEEDAKQKFSELAAGYNHLISAKSSVVTTTSIDGTKAVTKILMTFIHSDPEDEQTEHEEGLSSLAP